MLVAYICPICALLAPCPAGAALRDLCQESRFQGTRGPSRNKGAILGVEAPVWGPLARREERAYRAYVSDEQRRPAGCIGGHDDQFLTRPLVVPGIITATH